MSETVFGAHVEQPYYVTGHAVRQYQRRVDPEADYEDAVVDINLGLQGRVGLIRPGRSVEVSDADHRFVAVIKEGEGPWPAVITVVAYDQHQATQRRRSREAMA